MPEQLALENEHLGSLRALPQQAHSAPNITDRIIGEAHRIARLDSGAGSGHTRDSPLHNERAVVGLDDDEAYASLSIWHHHQGGSVRCGVPRRGTNNNDLSIKPRGIDL